MRHAAHTVLFALLLAAAHGAAAQPFERRVAPFPVEGDDGPLAFSFYGGLAAPRVQLADLDGDGDLDLFLQDAPEALVFFENVGTPAAPRFVWRTDRYAGLDVGQWARFGDLDDDGDFDVLAEEPFSRVRYYRNAGTPEDARFVLAEDTLGAFVRPDDAPARDTILVVDRQNVPALADLDCDGHLDLLTATIEQGTLIFYAGAAPEAGVPRFRFVSSAYDSLQIVGFGKRETRHGANALALGDVDGDGDPDLLWGDFFSTSLYFIENRGACGAPDLERVADVFPEGFRTAGYNAPHLADLDADGDLDLLVGVLNGALGTSPSAVDNLYYFAYEDGAFVRRTSRFLPMIDVGAGAAVAAGDVDGDGDPDLVVGNEVDPLDATTGVLHRFVNTGSAAAPSYRRAPLAVPGLAGYNLAPALGDLDGDGDPDLLVGTFSGRVAYARNDGGAFTLVTEALVSIRDRALGISGSLATPTLGDLDGDGDLDLVVGESSGALNLFRNDGTPTAPAFTFVTDAYLGLDPGARSAPALADLDGDGDLDLLAGTDDGTIHRFRNDGRPSAPAFVAAAPLDAPAFRALVPAAADLDGDGDADIVAGTSAGGLVFYRNARVASPREDAPAARAPAVSVYPNPLGTAARVRFTLPGPARATVDVYDLLGRRVLTVVDAPFAGGAHDVPFDAAALPAGAYVYRLYLDGRPAAGGVVTKAGR